MKQIPCLLFILFATTCGLKAQELDIDKASRLYGYRNTDGTWKIEAKYQKANKFTNGARRYAVVKYDNRWGCIDPEGNMVVRCIFATQEEADNAGKEWLKAEEPGKWVYPAKNTADGRWGYVNYYGQWKFQPEYEAAGTFVGNDPMSFATVKLDGRWGCIDAKGILIINNIFLTQEQASIAGQQWIFGLHYNTWRYPTSDPRTGRWGYVNYLGRWVIEPKYEETLCFGNDNNYLYTQVKSEGRWGNIDRNGHVVSECIFFTKEEAAYALVQKEHNRDIKEWKLPVTNPKNQLWGWVDYEGNWVIQPEYEAVTNFANDTGHFATVKTNGFWGCIDNFGVIISKPVFVLSSDAWQAGNEWDTDQELGHWLHPIKDTESEYWGYVDYAGHWVIQPTFEEAKLFIRTWNNRIAPVKQSGRWGCIDHTGRFVVTNQFNSSSEAYVAARQWAEKQKF